MKQPDEVHLIRLALEHLVVTSTDLKHEDCALCKHFRIAKPKGPMKGVVPTDKKLSELEAWRRRALMLAGPEEPVADSFRYKERE